MSHAVAPSASAQRRIGETSASDSVVPDQVGRVGRKSVSGAAHAQ